MKRVVITGLCPITLMGTGNDFFERLYKKEPVIHRIPDCYCGEYKPESKWYVPYPDVSYSQYGKKLMRMSVMASKNACTSAVAAINALSDAGIEQAEPDTAVIFGNGMGNIRETVSVYRSMLENKSMNPCAIPMMMANSISAWIAILLDIHGKNEVVSTACASGTDAVGNAYCHIRNGISSMAICGGADCFIEDNGMILQGFDSIGALTKSDDGLPRPFSEERSGFLYSEGAACALILEEYEHAKSRNADIYAEITGYETSCDGYHIVQMSNEPQHIINMMQKIVADEKIDYYNAHGTGTELNDKTERYVLEKVFGNSAGDILVNSTKSMIGHSIGAAGAIEAAVCAYSIRHGKIHGNLTGTPLIGLRLPTETTETDINTALSASFGFGGHNAVLKFKHIGG